MNADNYLDLARTTIDVSILDKLKNSVNYLVRRAVARNKHASNEILNYLSHDPVLNVSYMAINNSNYFGEIDRFKGISHPCVLCEKDETSMVTECNNCQTLSQY